MMQLDVLGKPRVGVAYGPGVSDWLGVYPGLIDYVEIPFEQLRRSTDLRTLGDRIPLLLHCASLSLAGFVAPNDETIAAVGREAIAVGTPWISEHLAFISADALDDQGAPAPALTYTMCPQLSHETIARVVENVQRVQPKLPAPLIVENSPQYFDIPGSTLPMSELVREVAEQCDINLLLDLTHFLITATNTFVDPRTELERYPLERVLELHVSGMTTQSGLAWDDHAAPAPPLVFELLDQVLARAHPKALTLEYNWSARFPPKVLEKHLETVRERLGCS